MYVCICTSSPSTMLNKGPTQKWYYIHFMYSLWQKQCMYKCSSCYRHYIRTQRHDDSDFKISNDGCWSVWEITPDNRSVRYINDLSLSNHCFDRQLSSVLTTGLYFVRFWWLRYSNRSADWVCLWSSRPTHCQANWQDDCPHWRSSGNVSHVHCSIECNKCTSNIS